MGSIPPQPEPPASNSTQGDPTTQGQLAGENPTEGSPTGEGPTEGNPEVTGESLQTDPTEDGGDGGRRKRAVEDLADTLSNPESFKGTIQVNLEKKIF